MVHPTSKFFCVQCLTFSKYSYSLSKYNLYLKITMNFERKFLRYLFDTANCFKYNIQFKEIKRSVFFKKIILRANTASK